SVAFNPGASTNSASQTVTFTGGGGATETVTGSGMVLALMPGLSFSSTAGTITSPMVANSGGYISQSVSEVGSGQAGVTAGGTATYFFQITNTGQYIISASVLA